MLRQLDEAIATVEAETEQVKKEGEKKLELLMTKLVGLKTKKHKIEMQAEAEQDRVLLALYVLITSNLFNDPLIFKMTKL
ncbi:hypothetical protein CDL15_Pgr000774 [Punica granatum]|uniref:Uncharacterized protein n=1 Tax=Punica granatum TaxID=22663 RepID=A0A218W5E7_PUNGR|nr:hypothetical protein CDL15_Pgr000774 [Punica granatum]